MKKFITFLTLILFSGCASSIEFIDVLDQDYQNDLASENNRLAGDLYLDVFNDDLSLLTYDYYLTFITKNEAPSAKGFAKKIKNADYHYFKSMSEYFIIALYYEKQGTIILDNSNTAFLDSLHTYKSGENIPELSSFVDNYLNK